MTIVTYHPTLGGDIFERLCMTKELSSSDSVGPFSDVDMLDTLLLVWTSPFTETTDMKYCKPFLNYLDTRRIDV